MAVYRGVVTIEHPSLGGIGTNTWHARTTYEGDTGPDTDLETLSGFLETFYGDITGLVAGGTSFRQDGEWTRVSGTPVIMETDSWAVGAGTTTPPLPPATALVASWRTSLASKRARGRTFVGPLSVNTLQDNGSPTEAARDTLAAAGADLIAAASGTGDGAFVVWSTVDEVGRDFTSCTVANEFAVLRSRRD